VNATKNDESEVIEKLNKEIAALRKKLEGQAEGGSGVSSHEARLMEERYHCSPVRVGRWFTLRCDVFFSVAGTVNRFLKSNQA
jgi:hypothetical protein